MTERAPIDAAIAAADQASIPLMSIRGWTPADVVTAAVRAAAPILIAHGRELAADEIARHGAPTGRTGDQWSRDISLALGEQSTTLTAPQED